jgi:hypothetical protein
MMRAPSQHHPVDQVMSCEARPDRFDPRTLHCELCRLYWEISDPPPPRCRARRVIPNGLLEEIPQRDRTVQAKVTRPR